MRRSHGCFLAFRNNDPLDQRRRRIEFCAATHYCYQPERVGAILAKVLAKKPCAYGVVYG